MADVLLFHHAQGLTPGVRTFADDLRASGHTVHTPDLFDGRVFQSIEEGLAYIRGIGFDQMRERGVRVADELPSELVYAGFAEACADTARGPRSPALLLLPADQRAMGCRSLAGRRRCPNPRYGQ